MARLSVFAAGLGVLALSASTGSAQYPPPQPAPQPQPYPPQPAPQPYPQPPPGQPYPAPAPQPYPQQGQPYPAPAPQPYPPPAQPYPPPGQPYPAPYGQPGYGQPMPGPYPQPAPAPLVPPASQFRSPGEMAYLYGTSIAYGVGTGIWIDALAGVNDPGIAVIAPIAFGIAAPVGAYIWDATDELGRGVPSSIATGLLLGGVEGMAVSGLQWQLTGGTNPGPNSGQWTFPTWSSLTFLGATGGGIGGFIFGEYAHPDPRGLAFISSGAGWGSAFGAMLGAGGASDPAFMGNGAAIGGFISYNAGIAAAGFVSIGYTPSWESLKWMWLGDVLGTVATTPVYLFYINGGQAQHGLIANALGGLAGLGLAAALTANLQDSPSAKGWAPPFNVAVTPNPSGGATLSASGMW